MKAVEINLRNHGMPLNTLERISWAKTCKKHRYGPLKASKHQDVFV